MKSTVPAELCFPAFNDSSEYSTGTVSLHRSKKEIKEDAKETRFRKSNTGGRMTTMDRVEHTGCMADRSSPHL